MATPFGKHLRNIANDNVVISAIQQHGPLAYAVILKVDEYCMHSESGEISCGIDTYNTIALELNCTIEDVIAVVDYLVDKKFFKRTLVSLYHPRFKEIVAHYQGVINNRKAAAAKAENIGRPPKYSEKLDDKTKELFDQYISLINREFNKEFRGDKKTKRQFNGRIKEGYTLADFQIAIGNIKLDEWHTNNKYVHVTPEYMTRETQLNKWLHAKSKVQNKGASLSARLSQQIGG